jgi:hypothetical protein
MVLLLRFHPLQRLTAAHPKTHVGECHLAKAAPIALQLRLTTFTTQNAFNWFDPD